MSTDHHDFTLFFCYSSTIQVL